MATGRAEHERLMMAETVQETKQETPLDAFRRSAGFQIMFVLHSELEVGRAIDNLCASAEKFSAAMREWQPIDTAPTMRNILLFAVTDNDPYNWKMDTGHYSEGAKCWIWNGHEVRENMIQPTHWMPLPDPPRVD